MCVCIYMHVSVSHLYTCATCESFSNTSRSAWNVIQVWLLDQNLEVFTSDCLVSTVPSKRSEAKEEVSVTRVSKLLYKGSFLGSGEAKRQVTLGTC